MKNYFKLIFMGLLVTLLSIKDAYAGRRVSIYALSSSERVALRTQMMNYLNSELVSGETFEQYQIVNNHRLNDAYIHNYNEVFLGWHRRYLAEMEAYVMPRLSSSIRSKLGNLLPYWDPTTQIPSQFFNNGSVLSGFAALTNQNPGNSGNYNFNRFTRNNSCGSYNSEDSETSCNSQTAARTSPIDKFAADLECEHNLVHDTVGGVMANSVYSPASAIFWIWHAYVDERYWDFEICQGKYATLPYSTNFGNGAGPFWYLGSSNRSGRTQVTSANGPRTAGSHLTMDSNTFFSFSANEAILNLNLLGMSNVSLSFYWKEWRDEFHDEDGIFLSDGGPFVKVYDLKDGNTTWALQTLDISTLAADNGLSLTSTFRIKFQQYDNWMITSDGFAFDDVSVTGTVGNGHCDSFESSWDNWFDRNDDDINWTRNTGSTFSTGTGPTSAFSGDYYIYLEASGNGEKYPSKVATLQTWVRNPALRSLSFKYHMYGSGMGSLALQVSNSPTSGYTQIWNRTGDQGNSWKSANVSIPSDYLSNGYYLRFVGTTGSTWRSDMALDNICYSTSSSVRSRLPLDVNNVVAEELTLDMQVYPNPFSQSTSIEYTLTEATEVVITVRDITGREIKRIENGISQEAGIHKAVLYAENMPNGIYLCTLEAQGKRKTVKLIIRR